MRYYKVVVFYKGKQQNFIIKSLNKAEAIIDAKKLPGLLIKIEEIPIPFKERIKILKNTINSKILRRTLNYPIYIISIRQLVVLLKAGISLKDALEDIGKNVKDPLIKEIFLKSSEAIDSGKTISDVFIEYEQILGGVSLAMIKLGEQTGDLVMALSYLADIYENLYKNKKEMIKALRYPIMTIIFIIIAFVIIILMVVPKFKSVYNQLHATLPLPTKILLGTEYVLKHYGLLVLLIIWGIIFAIMFFYKASFNFKYKMDKLLLRTYLIKQIIEYSTLHKFLLILSSLVKSGIPLLDALKISESIVWNEVIREKLNIVIKGINKGRTLTEMFKETEIVNFIALRMISAGEESGELDRMLENAAKYYNDKFENVIENMQVSIEPIMLIVIGGLVLLIALGIFLPMWDLANVARNIQG